MKRILVFLISYFCIINVYANSNWVYVGTNEIGDTYFIDTNSIQKSGDSHTYWVKSNYGTRTPEGNLSSKVQRTINCRTREMIGRHFIFYDDTNNNGMVTSNSSATNRNWAPIAPDTVTWGFYSFLCK